MTSDFLLLQKIRNGNNHAGNQFVEKYYSFIYQYCFLHIHNQECAEDMVQETFVRFFGALMSGAEIGKAKSFTCRAPEIVFVRSQRKLYLIYFKHTFSPLNRFCRALPCEQT